MRRGFWGAGITGWTRRAMAVGPDYDIYEVINQVRLLRRPLRQRKLYYFNSDTALLEKVRYRLGAERGRGEVKVTVEISNWGRGLRAADPGGGGAH